MTTLPYLDASAVSALRPRDAVEALLTALRDGLDPTQGTPRTFVPLTHGEYIVMPAENGADTGVKIVTVAPGNRERGLPRIQGIYVLFDARTLAPRALLDGIELTVNGRLRSEDVEVHHGDTDHTPYGLGTFTLNRWAEDLDDRECLLLGRSRSREGRRLFRTPAGNARRHLRTRPWRRPGKRR